jgi:hypothetical protein
MSRQLTQMASDTGPRSTPLIIASWGRFYETVSAEIYG